MLTVTIPDDDLYERLADFRARYPDGVTFVPWQMRDGLPSEIAAQVDVVVIGHYWGGRNWALLQTLSNLKAVLLPSAGFEHALPHLPAGVTLCNGRGVHSTGTAELALALILASQRGLPAALADQQAERWNHPELPSLADRRVLVVGAGSVAQAVIARLEPFEVEITVVARTASSEGATAADYRREFQHTAADYRREFQHTAADYRRADQYSREIYGVEALPELLAEADVVVLTVPLDDSTYHLIDAAALAAMPDGALLVNVARGKVVNTDALLAELETGRLRAALDVTDPEPLPPGHPLWHAPNTIITAHQGGNSTATYRRIAELVERQLEHLAANEPLENVVSGSGYIIHRRLNPITGEMNWPD